MVSKRNTIIWKFLYAKYTYIGTYTIYVIMFSFCSGNNWQMDVRGELGLLYQHGYNLWWPNTPNVFEEFKITTCK